MEILSPRFASAMSDSQIVVWEECISPSGAARNLGVFLDQHFNMKNHVLKVCRSANAQLRNIAQVREVLPREIAVTLVHAFVTADSTIVMPSAVVFLHAPSPRSSVSKIPLLVRCIVLANPTISHQYYMTYTGVQCQSGSFLRFWRWHQALCGMAPKYISDLVRPYAPTRSLRSATDNFLSVPTSRSRSFGNRRFVYAAHRHFGKVSHLKSAMLWHWLNLNHS